MILNRHVTFFDDDRIALFHMVVYGIDTISSRVPRKVCNVCVCIVQRQEEQKSERQHNMYNQTIHKNSVNNYIHLTLNYVSSLYPSS